ncbi:MAG TPA: hypothetical protein VI072_17680 [Polyangiaceae bacterium]
MIVGTVLYGSPAAASEPGAPALNTASSGNFPPLPITIAVRWGIDRSLEELVLPSANVPLETSAATSINSLGVAVGFHGPRAVRFPAP